ncbi:MAG: DUF58 domain-containing protein [Actinomycetota bacterium]|nr:DUF58 domain-containing protein [Actinomycetota bacterium]
MTGDSPSGSSLGAVAQRAIPPGRSQRGRLLEPPAARQGPGPLPQPLVDALDVGVNRLVARMLPGARRASGIGLGIELAQLRPYEVGDDVRHIDPAATARSGGQPHVRLQVPERSLTTWIALDVSPSMAFGTAQRLKADVAEGVALVFGRLGVRRTGSVGLVGFGAGQPRVLPPRGSKPAIVALRRTLAEGVARDGEHDPGALADALARMGRLARQPGLAVVVSDFREQQGWERPLGSLRVRQAVLAVEIVDPREGELPALGHLALVDPETGARLEVNTSNRRLRERFAELERERRQAVADELRRLRIKHVALSTGEDWLLALGRQLRVS